MTSWRRISFVNWEDDNAFSYLQEVQLGKMLTRQFGVNVLVGAGVIGDDVADFTAEVGFRYLF